MIGKDTCISSAILAAFMNQQIKYTCIIINNVHLFSGGGGVEDITIMQNIEINTYTL